LEGCRPSNAGILSDDERQRRKRQALLVEREKSRACGCRKPIEALHALKGDEPATLAVPARSLVTSRWKN